jgi:hypothetical protein
VDVLHLEIFLKAEKFDNPLNKEITSFYPSGMVAKKQSLEHATVLLLND